MLGLLKNKKCKPWQIIAALVIAITEACGSLGPSHTSAVLFRGLLVISIALHIPD
jgi:hypothetical protein